jgi:hypothetical protein
VIERYQSIAGEYRGTTAARRATNLVQDLKQLIRSTIDLDDAAASATPQPTP